MPSRRRGLSSKAPSARARPPHPSRDSPAIPSPPHHHPARNGSEASSAGPGPGPSHTHSSARADPPSAGAAPSGAAPARLAASPWAVGSAARHLGRPASKLRRPRWTAFMAQAASAACAPPSRSAPPKPPATAAGGCVCVSVEGGGGCQAFCRQCVLCGGGATAGDRCGGALESYCVCVGDKLGVMRKVLCGSAVQNEN